MRIASRTPTQVTHMLILAPILLAAPASLVSDDLAWPQFRGPLGNGHAPGASHPLSWDAETNVAWSIELPGSGWSSPVVVGDRVMVTAAVRGDGGGPKGWQDGVKDPATFGGSKAPSEEVSFRVMALSLSDGSTLWDKEVLTTVPRYGVHPSNTYATETPASNGRHVFANFASAGVLVAFDLEGEEAWRSTYEVRKIGNDFGTGSSVVVHDDRVFIKFDNDEESFLRAHDAGTGEVVWSVSRPKGSSWSTPSLWKSGDRVDLVACGPDHVVGHDPATGEVRWKITGVGGSFSASPAVGENHLYTGNSGPMARGPLFAIAAGAEGEHDLRAEEAPVAWVTDRAGPGMPSPVEVDGKLFVIGSMGVLECVDSATGERIWRDRLPDSASVIASPWVAAGHLFVLDEIGQTFAVRIADEFEVASVNTIEGLHWSSPSVAGDSLLIRSAERLTCVRE